MNRARISWAAVAVALILASCGGDSAGQTTITAVDQPTTSAAGGATTGAPSGATASITIADFTFTGPDSVAVGTTVTVTNEDGVSHTFTSEDDVFDSDAIATGESFQFTFDESGEYTYFCKFHPQMTGTLNVEG